MAPATGPFARADFLAAVADAMGGGEDRVLVSATGAMAVSIDGTVVRMAGHPDLCDYHSPLGSGILEIVAGLVDEVGPGHRFDFDSLPLEVAEVLAKGLELAGLTSETAEHAVAAVLPLPDTFEEYLQSIGKKQRHELRRKIRRYEELVGPVVFSSHTGPGTALTDFMRLHRLSEGEKGEFMDDRMAAFFERLSELPGWRIDELRHPDDSGPAAMLFSYIDEEGYYLYNSAYDPELREASPGNVVLAEAIAAAIGVGLARFDFLKGDEEYKFRLGAERRPLYRVVAES